MCRAENGKKGDRNRNNGKSIETARSLSLYSIDLFRLIFRFLLLFIHAICALSIFFLNIYLTKPAFFLSAKQRKPNKFVSLNY